MLSNCIRYVSIAVPLHSVWVPAFAGTTTLGDVGSSGFM
jgi:hypothetical protein